MGCRKLLQEMAEAVMQVREDIPTGGRRRFGRGCGGWIWGERRLCFEGSGGFDLAESSFRRRRR
jgi:hypothetical protein